MQKVQIILSCLLLQSLSVQCVPCEVGEKCTSSRNLPGNIKQDVDCEYFTRLNIKQRQRYGFCGFIDNQPLICCPHEIITSTTSPDASQKSKYTKTINRQQVRLGSIDIIRYTWLSECFSRTSSIVSLLLFVVRCPAVGVVWNLENI